MDIMDGDEVQFLIAKEHTTKSEKIEYAVANDIACVSIDWITESMEVGYVLPYRDFLIIPSQIDKCSMLGKGPKLSQASWSNHIPIISCIQGDISANTLISEPTSNIMTPSSQLNVSESSPQVLQAKMVESPPLSLSKKNLRILRKPIHSPDPEIVAPTPRRPRTKHLRMLQNLKHPSSIPVSQMCMIGRIFQGLTFVISVEVEEAASLRTIISAYDGHVFTQSSTQIPDFAIVPLIGAVNQKIRAKEVVTSLFINDCLNAGALVKIEYYDRPIYIPDNVKPLAGCVIGISSYLEGQQTYLSALTKALGARHQNTFARTSDAEKGLYACTHLICPCEDGQEYYTALRWKLPAVTAEWLKACAEQYKLVDETQFLVGQTKVPERENLPEGNTMPTPSSLPNRQIATTKKHENHTPNMETPIISKQLKNNSIEDSPLLFKTPETLDGPVFQENFSPRDGEQIKRELSFDDNTPKKANVQQELEEDG